VKQNFTLDAFLLQLPTLISGGVYPAPFSQASADEMGYDAVILLAVVGIFKMSPIWAHDLYYSPY